MRAARKLEQPKPPIPVMRKPDSILVERHFREKYPPKKGQFSSPRAVASIAQYYKLRAILEVDFEGRTEIGMAEKPVRTVATLIADSQMPISLSVAEIVTAAGFEMRFVPGQDLLVRINDPGKESSGIYERAKTNLYIITEGERTRKPDLILQTAEALLNLAHGIDALLGEEKSQHQKLQARYARIREYACI